LVPPDGFINVEGLTVAVPQALVAGDSGRARGMWSFFLLFMGAEGKVRRLFFFLASVGSWAIDGATTGAGVEVGSGGWDS